MQEFPSYNNPFTHYFELQSSKPYAYDKEYNNYIGQLEHYPKKYLSIDEKGNPTYLQHRYETDEIDLSVFDSIKNYFVKDKNIDVKYENIQYTDYKGDTSDIIEELKSFYESP